MLSTNEIRQKYLSFFQTHGHTIIPSSPLLPENDPTTLFTGSGMQPILPYLLGERHPAGTRITDSQKCFRSGDIEEVGDNRHTTFFEMLGNWSLGDYFKKEQIPWMYEFLTKEIGLDPKNLYITVFRGSPDIQIGKDEEAIGLWQKCFSQDGMDAIALDDAETLGMRDGRIFSYPEKKNWWSRSGVPANMPVGEPGGPDTEMFWDFDPDNARKYHENSAWKDEPCHVNCDCGRFMEIGNNVFMQYVKTNDGFKELPQYNVDFGGGLERVASASNGDPDMFLIDAFTPAREMISDITHTTYSTDTFYAYRVILDHIRAATFLIGDGVIPGNKDQGYFVRRLIRRAVRFARKLGAAQAIVRAVAETYITQYGEAYPNLLEKKEEILKALEGEEVKFAKTLEDGLKQFDLYIRELNGKPVSGIELFNLVQTYGFPVELSEELVSERGLKLKEDARDYYSVLMEAHKQQSRTGSEQKFTGGLSDHSLETTSLHTATHLLHKALRMVLGEHVAQKGSNITAERLRFDFSHGEKMSPEQIAEVERIVNEQIVADLPVRMEMVTVAEAKAAGAIGLFEDKYATIGDKIKMYSVGEFSKEICGGPHVEHTKELGRFKIVKEEAVSAGVRRIKAILEK